MHVCCKEFWTQLLIIKNDIATSASQNHKILDALGHTVQAAAFVSYKGIIP